MSLLASRLFSIGSSRRNVTDFVRVAFSVMPTMYCFQCSREYVEEVTECSECAVGLVEDKPTPPEEVGEQDEPQVAYELYEWSFEARRMLEGLVTSENIAHGWQGAVLIVREVDEDRVDALVEQAEELDGPALPEDAEKIGYSMEDWSAENQQSLVETLGLNGIAHEFDEDGELVIAEEDEQQVDTIIENLSERLAIEDELGDASEVMEGLELNDLLGEVRGLANKLRKNPGDAKATTNIVNKADLLSDIRTPFGFDSGRWSKIRLRSAEMVDVLTSEDRGEDEVVDAANALNEVLEGTI